MEEQLILLAKERGFSSDIISDKPWKYSPNEELSYLFFMVNLQKWLREVHGIEISVRAIKWENTELKTGLVLDSYEYEMYPLKKPYYIHHKVPGFKTYELALEEALQESLKLLKNEPTNN
jgi:hypothetical protein